MATISEVKNRFLALQGKEIGFVVESLQEEKPHILDLNREQLYDGKTSLGQDLHPTYYEDTYFKTLEAAVGYSNWKDKITPNSRRTKGVPNLFINGFFYKSIDVKIDLTGLHFASTFDDENDIKNKYGVNIYGLHKENKADVMEVVKPSSISKIRKFLRL